MILKGTKRQIPNIEIFNSYGYKWSDVIEVDQSIEHGYNLTELVKKTSDKKVYYLAYNRKLWIPTVEVFLKAGYKSAEDEVAVVNNKELDYYRDLKLVQKGHKTFQGFYSKDEQTVYIITPFGTKRPIRSAEIFVSYGYDWSYIRTVPVRLVDAFPDTVLVRDKNDYKVYKIENGIKHWIVNQNAFTRNGFSFDQIEEITALDLSLYPEGDRIE